MNSAKSLIIARLIARLNVGGPATQAILMTEAFRKKGYRALLLTGENLLGGQLGEPDNVTIRPGRTVTAGLRASF